MFQNTKRGIEKYMMRFIDQIYILTEKKLVWVKNGKFKIYIKLWVVKGKNQNENKSLYIIS